MYENSAIAEATIRAGCQCYFGYPITPRNELTEYMATNLSQKKAAELEELNWSLFRRYKFIRSGAATL